MGDSNETITLVLDLDDAQFVTKALADKKAIQALGDKENTKGLLEGLSNAHEKLGDIKDAADGSLGGLINMAKSAGPVLAGLAVAAFAVKAAFDMTMEAEDVRAINEQFGILTQQAGISTETLKKGLEDAAGGLISETELLQSANKAIVEMGHAAEKLPQLLELSRKSAVVMGKSVEETFDNLQRAIATGNQRFLRQSGIIIDVNKAYQKYAESLGTTAGALTRAGQQQALLNAVLEKGGKDLAGIDENTKQAHNLWQQTKTNLLELGEAVVKVFDNMMGDSVKGWLMLSQKATAATKDWFIKWFGSEADAASIKVRDFGDELRSLTTKIRQVDEEKARMAQTGRTWGDVLGAQSQASLDNRRKVLLEQYEKLRAEKQKQEEILAKQGAGNEGTTGGAADDAVDKEKKLAQEAKFQQEMDKLTADSLKLREDLVNSMDEVEAIQLQRKEQAEMEYAQKKQAIENNQELTHAQRLQLVEQEDANHQMKLRDIERTTAEERVKLLEQYQMNSTSVFQGITRAAQAESAKQTEILGHAGKMGKMIFTDMSNLGVSAFEALGRGAATGSNEIAGAVLGAVGKMASNYGSMMMLASVFPPNPPAFIAGAALVTLGGFLGGVASGGASSAASAAGSSSIGTPSTDTGGTMTSSSASAVPQTPQEKKYVSITVQGHYFDTMEARTRFTEMVRESSDFTDFDLRKIGS